MPRFYIPHPAIENGLLRVKGPEVRHIRKVLRLGKGDQIIVFDGEGKEYEGRIIEEGPTSVSIKVENLFSIKDDTFPEVTLAQSLLKGEKMDYLIQKATELGVTRIIPFLSSRSIPLLERSKKLERHRRWQKIAIEASKQCGRGFIPKIEPLCDFLEMLSFAATESLRLFLYEREGRSLKEVLKEAKTHRIIFFIVGPEGGWKEKEVEEAKGFEFVPVSLGRRILRAETASLCLLSILQYEMGDIG